MKEKEQLISSVQCSVLLIQLLSGSAFLLYMYKFSLFTKCREAASDPIRCLRQSDTYSPII